METLGTIAKAAGYIVTIAAFFAILWKIYRKISALTGGQKSLLRGQITGLYYSHNDEPEPELREYERQLLDSAYEAYTALNGNSYIKDIYAKMRTWKVVT